jgi:gamma-glutamylcyclotransferase (GGCT)/AIG2-like uncharacterized protein YtfP
MDTQMKNKTDLPVELKQDLLFVYGSLKRGEGNYRYLEEIDADFVCNAQTVELHPMVDHGIPFLYMEPGVGHNVRGEVHSVKSWKRLDLLESSYVRKPIHVRSDEGTDFWVWAYFARHQRNPEDEMIQEWTGSYRRP